MHFITKEITEKKDKFVKAVFSSPKDAEKPKKITVRKFLSGTDEKYAAEYILQNKSFTKTGDILRLSEEFADAGYKAVHIFFTDSETDFLTSKKGKVTRIERKSQNAVLSSHNKEKNYLIPEGADAPFLKELGIFTSDGKVVSSMQDKFRQINRFAEILDHALRDFDKKEVSVLDFGCGKSYLTFVLYYYFAKIRGIKVRITGYDLKADVVEHCNSLAKKYGYAGLSFVTADVSRDKLSDEKTDIVISLHACDTATDFALDHAITHGVKYIFSVPCCQHEINSGIKYGGDFDILLKDGLFKERFSALLTDAARCEILRSSGYDVDVLEFVDFAHSPKNVMIRAKFTGKRDDGAMLRIKLLKEKYGFEQTLYSLTESRRNEK